MSFLVQLMCYTMNVVPDVKNVAIELIVHIGHPGPEHCNTLVLLNGYLKGTKKKVIIIRKPKFIKVVIFVIQIIL